MEEHAVDTLIDLARVSSSHTALVRLLETIGKEIKAKVVAFYSLAPSIAGFRLEHSIGDRSSLPLSLVPAPGLTLDTSTDAELVSSLRTVTPVFPVRSDKNIVGLVAYLPAGAWNAAASRLAVGFIRVSDQLFYERLLLGMQQPVDYKVSSDDFYAAQVALLSLASDMEFVVIRDLDDDGILRCVGSTGFPTALPSELDIDPTKVPIFRQVLETAHPAQVESLHTAAPSVVGDLAFMEALEPVQSFVVVPVLVGHDTTGVLSFASRLRASYSEERVSAFLALSNGVGVSIANFEHFHSVLKDVSQHARVAVSITAIEVAQSARHEAKALVGNWLAQLSLLDQAINKRDTQGALDRVDRLRDIANSVSMSIDKIRSATEPPRQELRVVQLESVWDEARDQVIARLNELKIKASYVGRTVEVEVYPEWLRHVFLNLILNSCDAFSERRRKGDRRITLRLREETTAARIALRYTDNAGGIAAEDFVALQNPDGLPLEQLIFEPDITTKAGGSGWGLFLAREIMQRHGGSIDVVALRQGGGVTFDLYLPVRQDER